MPCFSNIRTVLIDLKILEAAAKELGITVEKRNVNTYVLRKGNEHITIERSKEGEVFFTQALSGSNRWNTEITEPLVQNYAKRRLKQFAEKRGYTLSAGSQQGEYILTSYKA